MIKYVQIHVHVLPILRVDLKKRSAKDLSNGAYAKFFVLFFSS